MGILSGILAIFFTLFGLTAIFDRIRVDMFGKYLLDLRRRPEVDLHATVRAYLNAPPWEFDFDKYVIIKREPHDPSHTV
jgi:hypothetical protein